jgi:hypothetical protein
VVIPLVTKHTLCRYEGKGDGGGEERNQLKIKKFLSISLLSPELLSSIIVLGVYSSSL